MTIKIKRVLPAILKTILIYLMPLIIRKIRIIRVLTRMNLDWGVEELILGNLVVIEMVWIGRVVQVAPLTSKRIPLNSQGAPLAPQ